MKICGNSSLRGYPSRLFSVIIGMSSVFIFSLHTKRITPLIFCCLEGCATMPLLSSIHCIALQVGELSIRWSSSLRILANNR